MYELNWLDMKIIYIYINGISHGLTILKSFCG